MPHKSVPVVLAAHNNISFLPVRAGGPPCDTLV